MQPQLVIVRGKTIGREIRIYEGPNFIGRIQRETLVDIDLSVEEPDKCYSSREHALITYENRLVYIEDLDSANGTFVNRNRLQPRQKTPLRVDDVIQVGSVQLKLGVVRG